VIAERLSVQSVDIPATCLCLAACAAGQLANVSMAPTGEPASPPILGHFEGDEAVHQLLGSDGLAAHRLNGFDPITDIAFWSRGRTNGETDDWAAFFASLDEHFSRTQE